MNWFSDGARIRRTKNSFPNHPTLFRVTIELLIEGSIEHQLSFVLLSDTTPALNVSKPFRVLRHRDSQMKGGVG